MRRSAWNPLGPILLLAACGGPAGDAGADAGVELTGRLDLLDPDLCQVVEGELSRGRDAWLTAWYGVESEPRAPALLGDERPSLLASTPSRLRFDLPAAGAPRLLRCAARRERPGADPSLRAEIFWQGAGAALRSLTAVEMAPEDDRWHELEAELPAEAGELWLIARHAHPGLAAQPGMRLAWGSPVIAPAQPPDLPDIILLTVDTLRADAIARMPAVQKLFASSEWAGSALAPSNWTLPSFASLWTGLAADQHGAGRGDFSAEPRPGPEARAFTALGAVRSFPEALHDAGWATACVHQNPFLESWTGLDRGFDAWIRTRDEVGSNRAPAEAWWRANAHRPRLLVLHWMTPHRPYGPPDAADPLDARGWRAFLGEDHTPAERRALADLDEAQRAELRRRYYVEAEELDRELAAWLPGLLASARRPVLLFYSDHGEELWDAGSFEHGHSFDDSVVRVPAGISGLGAARALDGSVPAGHLGLHLLHRLAASDERIAAALRRTGAGLPGCGLTPDCPAWSGMARSSHPLYRAEFGGVELDAGGRRVNLPFHGAGSGGEAPALDPATMRRLVELGYAGR